MFDKVSRQHRSAKGSEPGAGSDDANALIERELTEIVRLHLAREAGAADIIQRLSYKIDQDSELAMRAREYAGRLKLLVARISALLPEKTSAEGDAWSPGACSELIIQSLDARTAHSVLRQFILHHAPIPSATLISAGERLRSRGFERLWQRVAREREKVAVWLREADEGAREDVREALSEERARSVDPSRDDVTDDVTTDNTSGSNVSRGAPDNEGVAVTPAPSSHGRLFYNPPQIVRWM